ncbi:hypothetical protein EMIT0232MI5_20025 [Pseudomonas sp. IT-232MI5]
MRPEADIGSDRYRYRPAAVRRKRLGNQDRFKAMSDTALISEFAVFQSVQLINTKIS